MSRDVPVEPIARPTLRTTTVADEFTADEPRSTFHHGVYVVVMHGTKVLAVRKTRGPYTGLFDLPGGRMATGECVEDTARREVREEVGVTNLTVGPFQLMSCLVRMDSMGRAIRFYHSGHVAIANIHEDLPYDGPLSADTAGSCWVDLADDNQKKLLSDFAQVALRRTNNW